MKSINFNTGIKRYVLNDDETNVISINIGDINLIKRIQDASGVFDAILSRLNTEENTPDLLAEIDEEMKKELDRVFGTDISAHAFGGVNCLSPLDDGNLLFMSFFEAFTPVVLADMKASGAGFKTNSQKKMEQYLPESKTPKKTSSFEDMKFTPEQIEFLKNMQK